MIVNHVEDHGDAPAVRLLDHLIDRRFEPIHVVGERAGVRYYDDSKATNVGSVVGSLTGFERTVVLIAGGKDKGGDYAPLLPLLIWSAAGRWFFPDLLPATWSVRA